MQIMQIARATDHLGVTVITDNRINMSECSICTDGDTDLGKKGGGGRQYFTETEDYMRRINIAVHVRMRAMSLLSILR